MLSTQQLAEQQSHLWRVALRGAGVPEDRIDEALFMVEKVFGRMEGASEEDIEKVHGFGDWTRGYATLAVAEVIAQGWDWAASCD